MIRNLKALILAGMALAVFGALAVSSAQAHTPARFNSDLAETTITVKTDGTGKTAHQVFDAPGGGAVTCDGVSGHGLVKGAAVTSIDMTLTFEANCTAFGQPATVHTTNCVFGFKANGEVELKAVAEKVCNLAVTALGCEISFTTPNTYSGITYHNINTTGETVAGTATYTTVSAAVSGIKGTESGAGCPAPGGFTTGEFTTGNATVEGENVQTKEEEEEGKPRTMTSVWWTPTVP